MCDFFRKELIKKELFYIVAAFSIYFSVTLYHLTARSLWFDETIEFWYSRIMSGYLPYDPGGAFGSGMYEHILDTFQPPLYNIIMFFWLNLNQSEYWFRLFGVLIGAAGHFAIFLLIRKMHNERLACLAVVFSSFIPLTVHYLQEASEYCLAFFSVCLLLYFWLMMITERELKYIIIYVTCCIVAAYSQYGTFFPVLATCIISLGYFIWTRDRYMTRRLLASYFAAAVVAGVPLFLFFLGKQLARQQSAEEHKWVMYGGPVNDMAKCFVDLMSETILQGYPRFFVKLFVVVFIVVFLSLLIITRSTGFRLYGFFFILNWLVYYFAVKLKFYSYGVFGLRYAVFYLPILTVMFFYMAVEIAHIIKDRNLLQVAVVDTGLLYLTVILLVGYGVISINKTMTRDWWNEDIRGVTESWSEKEGWNKETLVYYAADSGFSYYIRQLDNYVYEYKKNIKYMEWVSGRNDKEYEEYFRTMYGEMWPKDLFFVASHVDKDMNTILRVFEKKGYHKIDIDSSGDAYLIELYIDE